MEQTIDAQQREIVLQEQRAETALAFKSVAESLREGLVSLARRVRIARTVKEPKTRREKEIWRKGYYTGQAEVMILVAQDWDRKFYVGRPGIMAGLDKETLESLPLNFETREHANDTCAPAPNKEAAAS